VFCQLAEVDGQPAGFALWYYTFSTFQGRHGIWLEDLFVNPQMRGRGVGKALLANLAQRCVSEGLGRYEWAVLDWNQPSIDFYVAQGAVFMDDWRRCRVSGEALDKLGAAA
jgi:GNAT superfamily N-acetyltransferase